MRSSVAMTILVLAAVAATTQRVARAIKATLACDGINVTQSNGVAAGQEVFHYHVHLIPRWQGDGVLKLWRPTTPAPGELNTLAEQIAAALPK